MADGPGIETVPGYEIQLRLESGLKGEVYRARQTAFGRSCLLTLHAAAAHLEEPFLNEATLAVSLIHPSIASVYEAGRLETGELFVVAEDPADASLRSRVETRGTPELLETIVIVRQAAEALESLHQRGLNHRALRPENIIVGSDTEGGPLVRLWNIDFAGVAERSILSNKFLIDTEAASLRYFSPEQCSGEMVGPGADIYSLGIILYEMLAGAPPFESARAAALIEMHRSRRPPDIKIDNFDLRMLITHAVMESLHKRPEKRQSSANALARQLRHIEQLASHVSTPPPVVTVPAPTRRYAAQPTEDSRRVSSASTSAESVEQAATSESIPPVIEVVASRVDSIGSVNVDFVREQSSLAISRFSRFKRRRQHESPALTKPETPAGPDSEAEARPAPVKGVLRSAEAAAADLEREMAAVQKLRSRPAKKVSWTTPDDDIPSLEKAAADAANLQPCERPLSPEGPEPEKSIAVPKPQEASVPTEMPPATRTFEDTLIPITDRQAVESDLAEASGEIAARHPVKKAVIAAPPSVDPAGLDSTATAKPQHSTPKAALPASQERGTTPAQRIDAESVPSFKMNPRGIRISGLKGNKQTIKLSEPEEITPVSAAPSRFRVHLDQQRTAPTRRPARRVVPLPVPEAEFFPTLLGGTVKPAAVKTAAEPFLSLLRLDPTEQTLPTRTLTIGAGVVFVGLFSLFVAGSIWNVVSTEAGREPLSTRSKSADSSKAAVPTAVSSAPAIRGLPEPASPPAEPKATAKSVASENENPPAKNPVSIPRSAAPTIERIAVAQKEPTNASVPRGRPSTAAARAVTVTKPQPPNRPAEPRPAPITVRSNGATRPRVVQIPK